MTFNSEAIIEHTSHTWLEIAQQPDLWPITLQRVAAAVELQGLQKHLHGARVLLSGAGTSAYAAASVASAWPGATAVPSTDLIVDTSRYIKDVTVAIAIGRSGNSPESISTVERLHSKHPHIVQLAITCNAEGALANSPLVTPIVLDPRTDDKSLVMTSSFSNLILAGHALSNASNIAGLLPDACASASARFNSINEAADTIASLVKNRIVFLSSSPLFPWAQEAALKALEMTAGKYVVLPETFLGLRHGPMSFLDRDSVVLCLLSNSTIRRRYELDLIEELKTKGLGRLFAIGATADEAPLFDGIIPAVSPSAPDEFRTPLEILAPQLLGYHLSLRNGLDPDNPSLHGVINRVVTGVKIYDDPEA